MADPTPQSSGLDIERLREIAEKAGAQPHLVPSDEWQPRYEAYADAFGPTTVLTILTRLQSLEVENARLLGESRMNYDDATQLAGRLEAAEAALALVREEQKDG